MPHMRAALACSILMAGAVHAARADVTEDNFHMRTTGDLVALCSAAPADRMMTAAVNFCHGFALGTYRVLAEVDSARRGPKLVCLPTPAPTRNDAIAQFVAWARESPERLSLPPADGLIGFAREQYPCPRGQRSGT